MLLLSLIFACQIQHSNKGELANPSTIIEASANTVIPGVPMSENNFISDLIVAMPTTQSWVLSPYSLRMAFAMTYLGSDGLSNLEMAKVFGFEDEVLPPIISPSDHSWSFDNANTIFASNTLSLYPTYVDKIEEKLQATLQRTDFQNPEHAALQINNWVDTQTHHEISEILKSSDILPHTQLVLVNALFFEGNWNSPFDPNLTNVASFFKDGHHECKMDMMKGLLSLNYTENEQHQIIELPYQGSEVAMYLILPKKSTGWLDENSSLWSEEMEHMSRKRMWLSLPKWKLEFQQEFSAILNNMGVISAFNHNTANFRKMSEMELVIDKVQQKSKIQVNETGTIAAATTAVTMIPRSGAPIPSITADHPFYFVIQHQSTKEWLFVGLFNG